MRKRSWNVVEAKAKLGEVIDKALSEGPQIIKRNNKALVVVVPADEWARKGRNLADFFAASPFRNSRLKIERLSGGPRVSNLA